MELLTAIALLCQIHVGSPTSSEARDFMLKCQQYYVHCVGVKTSLTEASALKQCILEKR